jgi:anionic cell wall polymer biosynthesis LytR-Cps2A-Psr (LCP) family protein
MNKPRQKNSVRTALVVLCIVLVFILTVMAGLAIYVTYLYNRMEYVGQETTISPEDAQSIVLGDAEKIDPDDDSLLNQDDIVVDDEYVYHEGQGDHIVNIMLVGQDAREGERVQRSDTMILVTFNRKPRTITLTSLMRDQYVNIPG